MNQKIANQKTANQKTAFISAAADGIGFAVAETLAAQGCAIVICDIDGTALEKAQAAHKDWRTYRCDVGDASAVADMFADIHQRAPIDILINNAGIAGVTAPVEEVTAADWRDCLDVSLDSHLYCTAAVVPSMKTHKQGVIVNITSTAGLYGYPNRSPYVAAKWAICGLTKSWAMELGSYNIRVNAIAPGSVSGDRMQRVMAAEAALKKCDIGTIEQQYCLGVSMQSFVEPQEIASMVGFLCSPEARHISGQIIAVDGHTETLHVRR